MVYHFIMCNHQFVQLYYREKKNEKREWIKISYKVCKKCFVVYPYNQIKEELIQKNVKKSSEVNP